MTRISIVMLLGLFLALGSNAQADYPRENDGHYYEQRGGYYKQHRSHHYRSHKQRRHGYRWHRKHHRHGCNHGYYGSGYARYGYPAYGPVNEYRPYVYRSNRHAYRH